MKNDRKENKTLTEDDLIYDGPIFFGHDSKNSLESLHEANKIAFAPIYFQASRILIKKNVLAELIKHHRTGLTSLEIANSCHLSEYGAKVLLEAGLGAEICVVKNKKYFITKTGYYLAKDKMTQINLNFVNDVCYKAMWHLESSINHGKPEGLSELGPWETVYQGLNQLLEPSKKSWFEFDHFYSDQTFTKILPKIFESKPSKIFDIGGNTGKFSLACCQFSPLIEMVICDLPIQLDAAKQYLNMFECSDRIKMHAINVLKHDFSFPGKADAMMMSQFLDCFSLSEIKHILEGCKKGLKSNGVINIVENFWDRQTFKTSAFCLQQTSLYFTAIANGNSKMYHSSEFIKCIISAGYDIVTIEDNIGICHTLIQLTPKA